jgi:hypothetical protein
VVDLLPDEEVGEVMTIYEAINIAMQSNLVLIGVITLTILIVKETRKK